MTRRLRRILICLVLGAVTTIVLAFIVDAALPPVPDSWNPTVDQRSLTLDDVALLYALNEAPRTQYTLPGVGRVPVLNSAFAAHERHWPLGRVRVIYEHGEARSAVFTDFIIEDTFTGWPLEAWHSRLRLVRATGIPDDSYHIIWPGFLIDSIFCAAIWCGFIVGIKAFRRALRRQRGCCPACGYDLRRDVPSGCPECGWGRSANGTGAEVNK